MNWSVIGSETVLVIAVVDGDLDGDTGVDEADDGGWDPDEVGVASIGSACETKPASVLMCFTLARRF